MIEALAALSDSAGRMGIEPTTTRKGLDEMAALLIAAHGLGSDFLGSSRGAGGHAPPAAEDLRSWLQARLQRTPGASGAADPGPSLPSAALAVLEAAERYRRAALTEADDRSV
jgi:hypothetical protein